MPITSDKVTRGICADADGYPIPVIALLFCRVRGYIEQIHGCLKMKLILAVCAALISFEFLTINSPLSRGQLAHAQELMAFNFDLYYECPRR